MSFDGRRAAHVAASRLPTAHPGWRLTRLHPPFGREDADRQAIANFYESFVGGATRDAVEAYRPGFEDWKKQLVAAFGSEGVWTRTAEGRVAFGQGDELVTEIGLRLHHTWGMPVIPGSALKGVCRDVARERFDLGDDEITGLFGDTTEAGRIRWMDALWAPVSGAPSAQHGPFALDTITVHHPEWYQKNAPPADWDSPTPLVHLTATGTFLFAVDVEAPEAAGRRLLRDFARRVLDLALAERGVGSRTRKGYGRFRTEARGTPAGGAGTATATAAKPSSGTHAARLVWNPRRGVFQLKFPGGLPVKELPLPPRPEPFGGPEAEESIKKQARNKDFVDVRVEWEMDGFSPRVTRVTKA